MIVSTPNPLDEMPDDLPDDLRQVAWRAVSAFYRSRAPHFPTALRVNAWHEDAQQEAELAVWTAAQRYDPAVGVSQAVFCYLCAMRALAKAFRKEVAWYGHICALVEVDAETGEEREREIADPGAEEAIWDYVLCQSVREALRELSACEQDLVEWHYGLGWSERAIAERLGLSKTLVHRRLVRIMERLRAKLGVLTFRPEFGQGHRQAP